MKVVLLVLLLALPAFPMGQRQPVMKTDTSWHKWEGEKPQPDTCDLAPYQSIGNPSDSGIIWINRKPLNKPQAKMDSTTINVIFLEGYEEGHRDGMHKAESTWTGYIRGQIKCPKPNKYVPLGLLGMLTVSLLFLGVGLGWQIRKWAER